MAINGYQEVASVRFVEGTNTTKQYNFAVYDGIVKAGDYALVKSNSGYGCAGFGVVKVVNVQPVAEYNGTLPTAEIICAVDLSEYDKRCKMRADREAIKKKMDKLVKQHQQTAVYQAVADVSPEMAELLESYNNMLSV